MKIGPVPGRGPAPTEPPYFSYGGGRGYERAKLDIRDDDGREAFLALAAVADVVVESFRPGVVDRLGIGYEHVSARNPAIVYCSTSGYGQDGPRSAWAGHDLDYLAVSGYLAMSAPSDGSAPPLPGATVADAAAGGMHAALSIMAALLARRSTGNGAFLDVPSQTERYGSCRSQWTSTSRRDPRRGPGTTCSVVATPATATTGPRTGASSRSARSSPSSSRTCVGRSDARSGPSISTTTTAQDEIRADLAAAFACRDRDSWVKRAGGSRHLRGADPRALRGGG